MMLVADLLTASSLIFSSFNDLSLCSLDCSSLSYDFLLPNGENLNLCELLDPSVALGLLNDSFFALIGLLIAERGPSVFRDLLLDVLITVAPLNILLLALLADWSFFERPRETWRCAVGSCEAMHRCFLSDCRSPPAELKVDVIILSSSCMV